ncbi:Gfo/Idh/MocA family oxidoreductase [Verrucomicrobiales bacterium]|nr:Gfo/Idh/MocA family oxidoreductase [Verrucomicrobiales bacterium]
MKIGLIGVGNWGKNLAKNFHDLGVLASIAEPSEELRAALALQYPNVALHDSYEAILADAAIDAVAIATPVPTHHKVASAAIAAGKDVFVEKPMTMTSAEAEDLVNKAEAEERILMVGHLLLYQPTVQFIKKYLDEGKLGKIYSIHQERVKLGRARYVENVTWSLGVHDVAVLLYLIGESPRILHASGHCGLTKKVEDDVYLHIDFVSGIKAHLHNSWLWPENRRYLTIVGEKGMLIHHEMKGEVELHRKTIGSTDLQSQNDGAEILFKADDQQPLRLELQHFLNCIENRATPISDGRNGVEVITALERIMMF